MAAERRYARHFASRVASDNEAEAGLYTAIEEAPLANADYASLQTIPGIEPRAATQLGMTVSINDFKSHDKLASCCGLAPAHAAVGQVHQLRKALARGQ